MSVCQPEMSGDIHVAQTCCSLTTLFALSSQPVREAMCSKVQTCINNRNEVKHQVLHLLTKVADSRPPYGSRAD